MLPRMLTYAEAIRKLLNEAYDNLNLEMFCRLLEVVENMIESFK